MCNLSRLETVDLKSWILTGYSSDHEDMPVVVLVKVEGFKTVFRQYTENGIEQTFTIPGKCLYMFSHSVPTYKLVAGETNDSFKGMLHLNPLAIPDLLECPPEHKDTTTTAAYPEAKPVKSKWSAKYFVSGQVWGVQDGFDFMPRQYVLVDKLVSGSHLKVSILELQPILNQERYWVERKLPIACGLFRVGGTTLHMKISQFSHLVNCQFITNGSFYKIYPRKGEIWVMYKDWDSKWKKSDFSTCKCGIVEILTDFCNKSGLLVARLEEVPGSATFFSADRSLVVSSCLGQSLEQKCLVFLTKLQLLQLLGLESTTFMKALGTSRSNSLRQNHHK